jgi:hypothetical protein
MAAEPPVVLGCYPDDPVLGGAMAAPGVTEPPEDNQCLVVFALP